MRLGDALGHEPSRDGAVLVVDVVAAHVAVGLLEHEHHRLFGVLGHHRGVVLEAGEQIVDRLDAVGPGELGDERRADHRLEHPALLLVLLGCVAKHVVDHEHREAVAVEHLELPRGIARQGAHPIGIGIAGHDELGADLFGQRAREIHRRGDLGIGGLHRREPPAVGIALPLDEVEIESGALEHGNDRGVTDAVQGRVHHGQTLAPLGIGEHALGADEGVVRGVGLGEGASLQDRDARVVGPERAIRPTPAQVRPKRTRSPRTAACRGRRPPGPHPDRRS